MIFDPDIATDQRRDNLEDAVSDVLGFWERVVNKADQTRTTGLSGVRRALKEGYTADTLKLAISRYKYDLGNSTRPLGLQRFFGDGADAPFRAFLTAYRTPPPRRRQEDVDGDRPSKDTLSPEELLQATGYNSFKAKDLFGKRRVDKFPWS